MNQQTTLSEAERRMIGIIQDDYRQGGDISYLIALIRRLDAEVVRARQQVEDIKSSVDAATILVNAKITEQREELEQANKRLEVAREALETIRGGGHSCKICNSVERADEALAKLNAANKAGEAQS